MVFTGCFKDRLRQISLLKKNFIFNFIEVIVVEITVGNFKRKKDKKEKLKHQ